MSCNVGIFYFSGTGTTKLITEKIKENFNKENYKTDIFAIEDILHSQNIKIINDFDYIGLGFPVHAFNAPRIFYKLLNIMPSVNNKKLFLFKTAGSPFINGGTTKEIKQLLSKKGFNIIYEELFVLASNVGYKLPDFLVHKLYDAVKIQIENLIIGIKNNEKKELEEQFLITVFSIILSTIESIGTKFLKYQFKITSNCIKCKKCIENCPQKNISFNNNKIEFDWHCIACLRCVYACPKNSIKISLFNRFIFDSFDINKILLHKNEKTSNIKYDSRYDKHIEKILSSKK